MLSQGSRGDTVKELQRTLQLFGYYGKGRRIDGLYGRWTQQAVSSLQQRLGLKPTGEFDTDTQNRMINEFKAITSMSGKPVLLPKLKPPDNRGRINEGVNPWFARYQGRDGAGQERYDPGTGKTGETYAFKDVISFLREIEANNGRLPYRDPGNPINRPTPVAGMSNPIGYGEFKKPPFDKEIGPGPGQAPATGERGTG